MVLPRPWERWPPSSTGIDRGWGHPARRVWLGAAVVVLIGAQLTGLLAFPSQG